MTTYWCEHAVVEGSLRHGVTLTIADGRFASITSDTVAGAVTQLRGLTVPGFANAHSHAFHRALRGRTQADRGSFWTWREVMYATAARLDPDNYHRLARAVFGEMTLAGMSSVGEFHYVHHQPDGTPYDDANAMGQALLDAAHEVGIRITLLDTLYLHGGLSADGYEPVSCLQRRYADDSIDAWAGRVDALSPASGQRIGAAIHSVRAVDPTAMAEVAKWAALADAPLHAHLSEQVTENEQCLAAHGCTPVELAARAGALDADFTAVHATHLTDDDVQLLAESTSSVCLCPTTERDLGDGIGPAVALAAAGVALGLGSDSHAVVDHLVEARCVELHERLQTRERGLIAAPSLLEMATGAGQRQLGWADAGAIAVGKRADLTTISLDSVRTAGAAADLAVETAIFAATAADITHVVVDGELIVDDRSHLRLDVSANLHGTIAELTEALG